jgi:hypothetical protein
MITDGEVSQQEKQLDWVLLEATYALNRPIYCMLNGTEPGASSPRCTASGTSA